MSAADNESNTLGVRSELGGVGGLLLAMLVVIVIVQWLCDQCGGMMLYVWCGVVWCGGGGGGQS